MLSNSMSIGMRTVKTTDLIVSSKTLSLAEVQANIDAYLAAGFVPYDITSTSSGGGYSHPGLWRLGSTVTTSTAYLCLFISTYPSGMYPLMSSEITTTNTTKDTVIMGVKVPTTSCVLAGSSDMNLDVWFTQYGYATSSHNSITASFENIGFNWWKLGSNANIDGINFNNLSLNNNYLSDINCGSINNLIVNNYQNLTLSNSQSALVLYNNVIDDILNNIYTLSIAQTTNALYIDDKYIYCGSGSSNLVVRINKSDFSTTASLNIGQNTTTICSDGVWLYCGETATNNIIKILIRDFSTTSTLGIAQTTSALCTDGIYVYCVGGGSLNMKRITISDFSTIGTLAIGQASHAICTDGYYVYCGINSGNNLKRVLISDFATIATLGIGYTTSALCLDNTYLYSVSYTSLYITRVLLSNFTTYNSLLLSQYNSTVCTDGSYIYSGGLNNNIKKILISDFSTIETIKISQYSYALISNGNYLFAGGSSGNNIKKIYIANSLTSSNFIYSQTLTDSQITSTSWTYLQADINLQYQIYYSLLGKTTRNFYNLSFRPDAPVEDSLKKFNAGRYWLWNRTDAGATLCPTTSGYGRIYNLGLIDATTTSALPFTGLPEDENILLRTVSSSGDPFYFIWYNDAVHATVFSNVLTNKYYTITHAFQILEFETISDLRNLVPNCTNSPMSGSLLLNNIDNEISI